MDKLAMYLRLSLEDRRFDSDGNLIQDESNSIGNQRKQILEYIHHDSELSKYGKTGYAEIVEGGKGKQYPLYCC